MGFVSDIRTLKEYRRSMGARRFWLPIILAGSYVAILITLSNYAHWPVDCDPDHHGRFVTIFAMYACSPRLISGSLIDVAMLVWAWAIVPVIIFVRLRKHFRGQDAHQISPNNVSVSE